MAIIRPAASAAVKAHGQQQGKTLKLSQDEAVVCRYQSEENVEFRDGSQRTTYWLGGSSQSNQEPKRIWASRSLESQMMDVPINSWLWIERVADGESPTGWPTKEYEVYLIPTGEEGATYMRSLAEAGVKPLQIFSTASSPDIGGAGESPSGQAEAEADLPW